jgi:hypothetical protein
LIGQRMLDRYPETLFQTLRRKKGPLFTFSSIRSTKPMVLQCHWQLPAWHAASLATSPTPTSYIQGRDAWSEVPADRFNQKAFYQPQADRLSTMHMEGGFFSARTRARLTARSSICLQMWLRYVKKIPVTVTYK